VDGYPSFGRNRADENACQSRQERPDFGRCPLSDEASQREALARLELTDLWGHCRTHELTSARRILLKTGAIDAIIDKNPELEAQTAVEFMAHHFGRLEAVPRPLTTPLTLFFRENC
jgi:hypothetical protein